MLIEQHLEELHASGLTDDVIKLSGIYTASPEESCKLLDRNGIDCPCLVFPYPNTTPTFVRLKPLGIVLDRNGEPVRYLQQAATEPALYIPKEVRLALDMQSAAELPVLITEGEKKALKAFKEGFHDNKLWVPVGLGGVWNWTKTITVRNEKKQRDEQKKVIIRDLVDLPIQNKTVYICFDGDKKTNDNVQQAENELSYYLTSKKNCKVLSIDLPNSYKLDDFIVKYGLEDFQKLIEEASNLNLLKFEIKMIRALPGLTSRDKLDKIANIVVDDQRETAKLFNNNSGTYAYMRRSHQLLQVEDEHYAMLIADKYGLYRGDHEFNSIHGKIEEEAFFRGKHINVKHFAYYDNGLFLYNNNGRVTHVTTNSINTVDNGFNDIYFKHKNGYQEITYIPNCVGYLEKYLWQAANFQESDVTLLGHSHQLLLLKIWLYTLFFPNLMPTKPILVMTGDYGSGKSTIQRLVGKLLFGNSFNVSTLQGEKDFLTSVISKHYLVYDNVDVDIEWVRNAIASLATGFKIEVRRLYTNMEMFEADPIAYLALNSMTQTLYKRPDIANRLLIFRTKKIADYIPEHIFNDNIAKYRNELLSELIDDIQKMLPYITLEHEAYGKLRMADFASLGIKLARGMDREGEFRLILDILAHEQKMLPLEESPLIELIEKWLNKGHYGEWVTASELFGFFTEITNSNKIPMPWKSTVSLGKALSGSLDNLSLLFHIEFRRVSGNRIQYCFDKKEL